MKAKVRIIGDVPGAIAKVIFTAVEHAENPNAARYLLTEALRMFSEIHALDYAENKNEK